MPTQNSSHHISCILEDFHVVKFLLWGHTETHFSRRFLQFNVGLMYTGVFNPEKSGKVTWTMMTTTSLWQRAELVLYFKEDIELIGPKRQHRVVKGYSIMTSTSLNSVRYRKTSIIVQMPFQESTRIFRKIAINSSSSCVITTENIQTHCCWITVFVDGCSVDDQYHWYE
jgi:hypothetical protein